MLKRSLSTVREESIAGEIWEVMIPMMIKVLEEVAVAEDVPVGVVMVTTLDPGMASIERETSTVARAPPAFTDGGLPTDIPSAGKKATSVAPLRLMPFTVRVKVEPTVCRMGMTEYISGTGRATRNMSAPEIEGSALPVAVFTLTVRGPNGASEEIERVTSM